jgi:LEA14-like dessication related protein
MQDLVIGNPEGIKVEELTRKNIGLQIDLPVENPNNFGFTVKGVDLDVYINDTKLGTIKKTDKIKIKSNSNEVYPIGFSVKPSDILVGAWTLIADLSKNQTELKLKGYVKVSKMLISKKIAVDAKQMVKIY